MANISSRNPAGMAYLCMGAAWLLWSMDPVIIRVIGNDVPRPIMAGMSALFGGFALLWAAIRGYKQLLRSSHLALLFLVYVVFFTTLADLAYVFAVRNLNPGLVSLVLRSQVVMAVLAAWWLFKERPDGTTLLGMAIVIIGHIWGAWLSLQNTNTGATQNTAIGWIFAFTAAILWTGGTLLGKKLLERIPSQNLCGIRMLTAGIITIGFYCACGQAGSLATLTGRQWLLLAAKGVFCSAAAYSLYLYGLHLSKVTAAAAIEQAAPLSTLFVATTFLHDTISPWQWLSVAVVTGGACVILAKEWINSRTPAPQNKASH